MRIIELWLDREGYDKIAQWVHHSPQSIKRYINAFLRIVALHRQGTAVAEIAFLVGASQKLVRDYVGVYEQVQTQPHRLEKLEEELARVGGLGVEAKKAVPHNSLRGLTNLLYEEVLIAYSLHSTQGEKSHENPKGILLEKSHSVHL